MISGVKGLEYSWSKRAREWGFADPEGVLAVTLSEALHSYRDYLLDLAGGALVSDVDTGELDAALDVLLRLSASTADGLWPARRALVEDAKESRKAVLGLKYSRKGILQERDEGSPWLRSGAYRLARAAVSLQISLAGDPDDDESACRDREFCPLRDSVLATLLQTLADAESFVLDAAEAAADRLSLSPEPVA